MAFRKNVQGGSKIFLSIILINIAQYELIIMILVSNIFLIYLLQCEN